MRISAMTVTLTLMTLVCLSAGHASAGTAEKDPWAPFQFLVGSWSGVGSGGTSGALLGSTTFSFELDRNVLVRRNRTEFPPKLGQKTGQVHEDLMIVYPQPGGQQFRAVYFDNEQHVIEYTVWFPAKQPSVVFDSEDNGKGPRFRLIYEAAEDGSVSVEFLMAPAEGAPLMSYRKGVLKREK